MLTINTKAIVGRVGQVGGMGRLRGMGLMEVRAARAKM